MPVARTARFQIFRGTMATWEDLFTEAAELATRLGPERVISISHSEDANDGVVTVWYWEEAPPPADERGRVTRR